LATFKNWHSKLPNRHIYDNDIAKLDKDNCILATALVIAYMKLVCSRFRTEWELYVAKLRSWIDSQLYDVDLCMHLSKIAMEFVRSRFEIRSIDNRVQHGK